MIRYTQTYERWTEADIEAGATDDQGIVEAQAQASFRDMVKALQFCERVEGAPMPWFTDGDWNNGTREWYEQGIQEARSYHPETERDARWMTKAHEYHNPPPGDDCTRGEHDQ